MQFKKFDNIPAELAMLKSLVPNVKINMPAPQAGAGIVDILINSLDMFGVHIAIRTRANPKKYRDLKIYSFPTNSVTTMDTVGDFTAVRLLYSKRENSRNSGNSCFMILESNKFSFYSYNREPRLVIDGSKVTNEEVTVTATVLGKPDKKASMKFKIEKVASWQEKANITNLDFNRFTSFGDDTIEISLGGNILEGNAATVKASADGMDDTKFDIALTKMQSPTLTRDYDGFFPLRNVKWNSGEQLYAAYKAGAATDGKNLMVFFTCTWETGKPACTESTTRKSIKYTEQQTPSTLGWYNETELLIFFHSNSVGL